MQNRGVQIVNVQAIFNGAEAEFVGRADGLSATNAAAGHPHGKAGGIMIAAIPFFRHRRATKLAAPHHERFVEQTTLFKICAAIPRPANPSSDKVVNDSLQCPSERPTCCLPRDTVARSERRVRLTVARANRADQTIRLSF